MKHCYDGHPWDHPVREHERKSGYGRCFINLLLNGFVGPESAEGHLAQRQVGRQEGDPVEANLKAVSIFHCQVNRIWKQTLKLIVQLGCFCPIGMCGCFLEGGRGVFTSVWQLDRLRKTLFQAKQKGNHPYDFTESTFLYHQEPVMRCQLNYLAHWQICLNINILDIIPGFCRMPIIIIEILSNVLTGASLRLWTAFTS